ncbi:hypothetical protein EWM64_g1152 [Hericium alpestre]|uniref:HAT C-terminal dimerisation domain-containing protein n=1 Tax=Hericium alpestre TaxID=135208 RepID=A0A4Z0A946_9AGAM|nr:hypothetical protein EWM64_g1152 [Hericium alpestre]
MEVRMEAILNGEVEDGDDEDGLVDETTVMSASEQSDFHHAVVPMQVVLVKLRKLAYKMIHSTTKILPAWRAIVVEKNLADRLMPRDVSTRWNSTYNMLVFVVDYQHVIRVLVADDEYDLQQYMMFTNEWKIVQQLRDVLKVLRDATEFFSQSVPNLTNVIPAMNYIDERFATDTIDEKYSVAIRASLSVAKRTLNRYYNLTDDSHVYQIAMVLHPAYKLKYFHDHGWEPEWIETAWQLVRDGWDHSYALVELEADEIEEAEGPAKPLQNMFDNMASISRPTRAPQDELTRYLTAATENVPDPILWWKTHKSLYPCLYHMAIDYLTIPDYPRKPYMLCYA